jgi:alkylhydroperoxidase family enzyme
VTDPRLAAADDEQIRAAGLLESLRVGSATAGRVPQSLLETIAHAGPVAASWLSFATALLTDGVLPARLRELAILRVAWRTRSEYVWGGHAAMAAAAGLCVAEVAAGVAEQAASEAETAVLRACDELLDTGTIADPTWDALAGALSPPELVELVLTVGNYRTVAWLDVVFQLRPEPGTASSTPSGPASL